MAFVIADSSILIEVMVGGKAVTAAASLLGDVDSSSLSAEDDSCPLKGSSGGTLRWPAYRVREVAM